MPDVDHDAARRGTQSPWEALGLDRDEPRWGPLQGLVGDHGPREVELQGALCAWLAREVEHKAHAGALRVGVHGPQGSGKSTLCAGLVAGLGALGLRAVTLSVDDLYLCHAEQRALAAHHSNNEYLEHRGYPGTHDLALGEQVLVALSSGERGVVAVPSYDKSAQAGRGDRRPLEQWPRVETPLDVVLLEGWMLGFEPAAEAAVTDPALALPNALLRAYAPWRSWAERWLVLELARSGDLGEAPLDGSRSEPFAPILAWRLEAERARRASGRPGLSEAEAQDYVRRFLPAYRLWSVPPVEGVRLALDARRCLLGLTLSRGAG